VTTQAARSHQFLLILLFFLAATAALLGQTAEPRSRIIEALNENRLVRLSGNTHPLARREFDQGVAPIGLPMERVLLVLQRGSDQENTLNRLMQEQLDRSSPSFHAWLTPEQFGKQFGPSDADLRIVTSWLASHGFREGRVSTGRTTIEFSGTAGQVAQAFHTVIHKYVVHGREYWANSSDPWIPSALRPVVSGVDTMNNFPRETMLTFPAPCSGAGIRTSKNCYGVGPDDFATIYNLLPLWDAGLDGTGQTIAIVGSSNIHVQDVRNFRSLFGLPASDPFIIFNGTNPGYVNTPTPDETEDTADVEWAGATATRATRVLVVSATTNASLGEDLSAQFIVDHNLGSILSASYGACEVALGASGNQFHNQLWQQAAAQGITVIVPSADSGSAACDQSRAIPPSPAQFGLSVNGIASTPYNVAIGGTSFADLTDEGMFWNSINDPSTQLSVKSYIPETTWNDTCTNSLFGSLLGFSADPEANCNNSQLSQYVITIGGGGGKSNCTVSDGHTPQSCQGGYPKPSWQAGPGVPADGLRDLPDLAIFSGSGLTGDYYLVCEADQNSDGSGACDANFPSPHIQALAGTSLSAPAFAGIVAMASQKSGSRQGNINPLLYRLAAQQSPSDCNSSHPASSCVFNDVTLGTIATPCKTGTPNCNVANSGDSLGVIDGYDATSGYDLATGWGSVNAFNLVNGNGWTNNTPPDFMLSAPNSTVTISTPGKSGTLTMTIKSLNGFGGTFTLSAASCVALPTGASCSFAPGSFSVSQTSPSATVTITVATTARGMARSLGARKRPWRTWAGMLAGFCPLCFGMLRFRKNTHRSGAAAILVICILLAGCGGSGNSNSGGGGGGGAGTPTGTANAIVTLSSAGVTHSFVFTVNVQ